MGCAAAWRSRSGERHALEGWWIMFTKRAFSIRIVRNGRDVAHVAQLAAAVTAVRPSQGCVGVWWHNPASGRLELRWQPAPESPVGAEAAYVAAKFAA